MRTPRRGSSTPGHPGTQRETLTKTSDGFVARTINRRISIPISRQLARTAITPNQISVFNLCVGLVAAGLASTGQVGHLMVGGFLFQLASILDGCDGEVATLTEQATPQGAWVDTVTDNVSYVAFGVGVTFGYYRRMEHPVVLVLGAAVALLMVMSLALMYICIKRNKTSGSLLHFGETMVSQARQGTESWMNRVVASFGFMVRRDFFALLFFVLALMNRLDVIFWLLFAGSVGLFVGVVTSYRRVSADLSTTGR